MKDSYETFLVSLFNVTTNELVTTHCADNKELAYLLMSIDSESWMVTKIDIILGWQTCKELTDFFNKKEDLNTGEEEHGEDDLL